MKFDYKYKPEVYNEVESWLSNINDQRGFHILTEFSPVPQFIIRSNLNLEKLSEYLNEFGIVDSDEIIPGDLEWEYDETVDYAANGRFYEDLNNITREELELWQDGKLDEDFINTQNWLEVEGIWLLEEVRN